MRRRQIGRESVVGVGGGFFQKEEDSLSSLLCHLLSTGRIFCKMSFFLVHFTSTLQPHRTPNPNAGFAAKK
jgi:hypothetical protein